MCKYAKKICKQNPGKYIFQNQTNQLWDEIIAIL